MDTKIGIAILGDVCPTEDYQKLFDEKTVLEPLRSIMDSADYSICNLECPATYCTKPIKKTGPNLRAQPECLNMLKSFGIDAISMGNNHVLDYGEQGVLETLSGADNIGLKHFGAGENKNEAEEPLIIEVKGKRITFISFAEHEFNLATDTTAGANWFDPYVSLTQIMSAKQNSDYLIVLYHGGIEHYKYPSPQLQKKCRAIIEAGADAVFCQHSHCIGTMETYQGKPIVYGQGNTVFGYRENSAAWNEGLAFTLYLDEGYVGIDAQLIAAKANGIHLADAEQSKQRLAEWVKDSECLSDVNVIKEQWNQFCKQNEALVLPNYFGRSRMFNKLNRMLKNKLVETLIGKNRYFVSLAYIRCEAHHEVVQTILENETNG